MTQDYFLFDGKNKFKSSLSIIKNNIEELAHSHLTSVLTFSVMNTLIHESIQQETTFLTLMNTLIHESIQQETTFLTLMNTLIHESIRQLKN